MNVNVAVEMLLALLTNAASISNLIRQAKLEGRSEFTPEEWSVLLAENDAARARLKALVG